jgi:hypothetical protein
LDAQLLPDAGVEAVLAVLAAGRGDAEVDTKPGVSDDHVVDDVVAVADPGDFEALEALERVRVTRLGVRDRLVLVKEGRP